MIAPVRYRAGYKYQTAEDYVAKLPAEFHPYATRTRWLILELGGLLLIREGYAWDGASGPAIDTKSAIVGSLVHDALYQLIRLGRLPDDLRGAADEVYKNLCLEGGMWAARSWWHFKGVRWFGGNSAEPDAEKPVLTAP